MKRSVLIAVLAAALAMPAMASGKGPAPAPVAKENRMCPGGEAHHDKAPAHAKKHHGKKHRHDAAKKPAPPRGPKGGKAPKGKAPRR